MTKLNLEEVYDIIKEILLRENQIGPGVDFVWIVSLSESNTILSIEEVSEEVSQEKQLLPQHVFRIALMKEANKIIMVHYHATGKLEPTEKELDLTGQMIIAGNIINVHFMDHLLVNEKGFFSFKEHGLMEELKKRKWPPPSLNGIDD